MTNLPTNTYYQNGVLINGNHTNINSKMKRLEDNVAALTEELNNVNKRLDELSNREVITKTGENQSTDF